MESVLMDFTKMVFSASHVKITASHAAAQLNVFHVLTQSTLNLSKNTTIMISELASRQFQE
jgi:hypothetical protein